MTMGNSDLFDYILTELKSGRIYAMGLSKETPQGLLTGMHTISYENEAFHSHIRLERLGKVLQDEKAKVGNDAQLRSFIHSAEHLDLQTVVDHLQDG